MGPAVCQGPFSWAPFGQTLVHKAEKNASAGVRAARELPRGAHILSTLRTSKPWSDCTAGQERAGGYHTGKSCPPPPRDAGPNGVLSQFSVRPETPAKTTLAPADSNPPCLQDRLCLGQYQGLLTSLISFVLSYCYPIEMQLTSVH